MRTEPRDYNPDETNEPEGFEAAVLMVVGEGAGSELRAALRSTSSERFELAAVGGIDAALEALSASPFDAVLLDRPLADEAAPESRARLRELAAGAPVILAGGDRDTPPDPRAGADEWLPGNESPRSIVGCVRGAVERRRLRDELRQRTEQLAESESRFRSIIERTADGIVIVGEDGRVRFVNPGAEQMFGRPAHEILGEDFGVSSLSGETAEMDIVRSGGNRPVLAELRVSPTSWAGEPAQVISLRDVTDRKEAEERQRRLVIERAAREQAEEAGRRFRFLAEAGVTLDASLRPERTLAKLAQLIVPRMADWCVIDVVDGNRIRRVAVEHHDPARRELLDQLRERFAPGPESPQPSVRVVRTGESELYRGLTPERMRELAVDEDHLQLLVRLGTRSSITVPLDGRDKRLGAITFVCGERDFDETDVALAREIASRAARALDNARLYEASVAANRAKSDFLAVMSHELRTPLNAIIGYTDLLLTGISGELDEVQTNYLGRVRSSAKHLLGLIGEILTFAQTTEGRVEVRLAATRIGDIVDEIVAIAEPLARDQRLDFAVEVPQPNETVYTDPGKLRQITLNLLTNAIKFTDEGSVQLRIEPEGAELVVAVTDTGVGMDPAEQEQIFEPFRQMDQGMTRRAGGTGLGLTVSRDLARLLGGDLRVESTPGRGSTFTLRVPRELRVEV